MRTPRIPPLFLCVFASLRSPSFSPGAVVPPKIIGPGRLLREMKGVGDLAEGVESLGETAGVVVRPENVNPVAMNHDLGLLDERPAILGPGAFHPPGARARHRMNHRLLNAQPGMMLFQVVEIPIHDA